MLRWKDLSTKILAVKTIFLFEPTLLAMVAIRLAIEAWSPATIAPFPE